ncbi:SDR family NAD(P)-dependent oxidoreductase [Haloarchaeobius sp. HRN-SO-5]|uniref:SDR family NAD(P)-dependent oxidoreductase n=1 Tax=Haloarchaeobius sp. HRN-SO-5 TaxID=3446118 RepID=UPI003EB72A56
MTDSAMVVGASSGIGEALARKLAAEGYEVGLAARRRERLKEIGACLPTQAYVARIDVTDVEDARQGFAEVADAMDGIDLVVLNAGVGFENRDLDWEPERVTVDTNVRGFVALATAAMDHFERRGHGRLVGISSVAARFGSGLGPAYNASKAFVSTYLDGLRYRARTLDADVGVTTIEPGYVDTALAQGTFWMAAPETAADQIYGAIRRGKNHAYVTRRWRLVAGLVDLLPDVVRRRLFS